LIADAAGRIVGIVAPFGVSTEIARESTAHRDAGLFSLSQFDRVGPMVPRRSTTPAMRTVMRMIPSTTRRMNLLR